MTASGCRCPRNCRPVRFLQGLCFRLDVLFAIVAASFEATSSAEPVFTLGRDDLATRELEGGKMRKLDRTEIGERVTAAASAATATNGEPTTLETMRRVLVEHYGIDANLVSMDQRLDSLGLDSLSFFEYIFELEKVLRVLLPDLPRDLVTVGDLVRFVEGELARQIPVAALA